MGAAFTTYWSRDRFLAAREKAPAGFRLDVMFGGPHVSEPSLRRAGVRAGDLMYPIHVHGGALYVLGRMRATRVLGGAEFLDELAREGEAAPVRRHMVRPPGRMEPTVLYLAPVDAHAFLAPTCTDEAVLGEGTRLWFDLAAPREWVESLRFTSRRGERKFAHVADGRVTSLAGLQGVYRLAEASARGLEELVTQRLGAGPAGEGGHAGA